MLNNQTSSEKILTYKTVEIEKMQVLSRNKSTS